MNNVILTRKENRMFKASVASILLTLLIGTLSFAAGEQKLTIGPKGEELLFDKTKLTVKAGQKVKLTFKNTSGMQHNWVLVQPGAVDEIAQASIVAGYSKGWIADSPKIIAHTKLVEPKTEETIEFTAPKAPGQYPYVCTFPGHPATMKGVLIVTK